MKHFVLNRSGFEGLSGTPLPGTTCYSGFDGFVRVENTSSASLNLDLAVYFRKVSLTISISRSNFICCVFQAMITDLLHEQPRFNDMIKFGNQLTTDPCVGLEERMRVQKEMQSLHLRWEGLYTSTTSRHDR